MEIAVVQADCVDYSTPLLAVMLFEDRGSLAAPVAGVDERLSGRISEVLQRGDFKAREGQHLLLYPPEGAIAAERVLLIGLGKREDFDLERIRRAAATAVKQAGRLGVASLATLAPLQDRQPSENVTVKNARALAEGAVLGSYSFDELKTKRENNASQPGLRRMDILEPVEERVAAMEAGVRVGSALGNGESLARTLGNLPGNYATPEYLAERARGIASTFGMKVTILGPSEMEQEGLGAILAVAQGSEQEPRLIVLEHRKGPAEAKPLVLLGKGLTFDAGGISIKPSQGMEEMKFDMCGGAAVLGAMHAIGELDVPANVVGVIPSSENLLSGRAIKPGDVIRSHLGKTIEVVNTDAEGRLILADALSYLRRFDPAAVVDAATLTGACVIALGAQASAVCGNDDGLIEEIRRAGDRVGERVWPLPMFEEYREQIKSDYADIKNSGGRPAGTITAAWFLREFVGDFPWAHLDIAGTAYGEGKLAYQTKGATGVPTRLFVDWVLSRAS
ncbi:MAG: leucyl aminopeptidase [Gemmatimonas sp.]|nr:leucyl aminopeptidase [Gemmatimonas sp.]